MRAFTDADRVVMRDPAFSQRYRQASQHDGRLDGYFVTGMPMSENFCRPGCSTRTPRPSQVTFYPMAAAAHAAGLRPCPRCRPDLALASPELANGDGVASRALRLIEDGEIDRGGVGSVARLLGLTPRHVLRAVELAAGCGPLDVARAGRVQLARMLLSGTALPMQEVAAAAGFASVRQFNSTVRAFYAATPGELRFGGRRRSASGTAPHPAGPLVLRCVLPVRAPFDAQRLFRALAERAVPDVEESGETWYARVVHLPHGPGQVRVDCDDRGRLLAKLTVADPRDLRPLYARTRRLLDSDADPYRVDRLLALDPALAPSVAAHPGIRVPGGVDPEEIVIRAIVEDRLPAASARTMLGGLANALGDPTPWGPAFPTADHIAERGRSVLRGSAELIETIVAVAQAMSAGELAPHWGWSRRHAHEALAAFAGLGPRVADAVAVRLLGERDTVPLGDEEVRAGAQRLGLPTDGAALQQHALRWSPARGYAAEHLRMAALEPGRV